MKQRRKQQGYILLPVVIIITMISIVALMMNVESALEVGASGGEQDSDTARYVAEAGLNHALWQVEQAGCGPYTDIVGEAFGGHSYDVVITPNQADGILTTYAVQVGDDAYIKEDTPTQNYGNEQQLSVLNENLINQRALYQSDILGAGIPVGVTVNSAILYLFVDDADESGVVNIHRITTDWSENAVTWNNIHDQFDPAIQGAIPQGPTAGEYINVNITALVQGWVNGSIPNQGIMLRPVGWNDVSKYSSKEYSDVNRRPWLEVATTTGTFSTRASISATGILSNGMEQTLTRDEVVLYQPPTSLTWQHDATLGMDAKIWDKQPNDNYGNAKETWVSSVSNDTTRSLLRFHVDAIPPNSRILEATLSLYRKSGSGSDQPVSAHRIKNSWSEDSVTWNSRESGTNWDTAGADYDPTAVVTTPVGPDNQRYEWNITPLVQGWVDGSYPNYGVALVAAIDGMPGEEFFTSDETDPDRRPNLSITYTCECGQACMVPQGSGHILVVVHNDLSLTFGEQMMVNLFEAWGYTYTLINDDAAQAAFNANAITSDVAFISESVDSTAVGTKLTNLSIGVVSAKSALNDELGISTDYNVAVGQDILVTDTTHEITSIFPTGTLQFKQHNTELHIVVGSLAPGAQVLAEVGGAATLVALEKGADMASGGQAAGRRVMIPLAEDEINPYLTNNGQLIIQRAIEWAMPLSCGDGDYADDFDTAAFNNNDGSLVWGSDWVEVDGEGAGAGSGNIRITGGVLDMDDNPESFGQPSVTRTFNLLGATNAILDLDFELDNRTDQGSDVALLEISTDGATWDVLEDFSIYSGRDKGHRTYDLSAYLTSDVQIRLRIESGYGQADEALFIDNLVVNVCGTLETPTSTEPIAHWPLDETSGPTAQDVEGGHDGDLIDDPQWMPGLVDGALEFDGDNYVNVPHDDTLSLTTFTISSWIRPESLSGWRVVLNKGNTSSVNYYLATHDSEISMGFQNSGTWTEFETTGAGLSTGDWYHIAASFDDTIGEAKIYLNGFSVYTGTTTASPPTVGDDIMIGNSAFDEFWSGLLDDMRIYNRVLGDGEVADLHTEGAPPAVDAEYADQFNDDYDGSDGSLDWSVTPWTEISDDDSASSGNIEVLFNNLTLDNRDGGDFEGIVRAADLSIGSPTSALLSFDYGGLGIGNDDDVDVFVSDNGGGNWVLLERLSINNVVLETRSYNLQDHISLSSGFQLKFAISSGFTTIGEKIFLDDVIIDLESGGGGGCNGTFVDAFNQRTYTGSDGILTWSTDWREIGESDGPTSGDIGVGTDQSDYQLRLRDNDNGGEGVGREADLSNAGSATLSFNYRRVALDRASDYVIVQANTGGTDRWAEIARFEGPGTDDTYQYHSVDISSYISATTRIRFITSSSMGSNDIVWIDNVKVNCSP